MTKKEMKQRLREEHEMHWERARGTAHEGFEAGRSDEDIADSLVFVSARINGIILSADALGVSIEKYERIDKMIVSLWRNVWEQEG